MPDLIWHWPTDWFTHAGGIGFVGFAVFAALMFQVRPLRDALGVGLFLNILNVAAMVVMLQSPLVIGLVIGFGVCIYLLVTFGDLGRRLTYWAALLAIILIMAAPKFPGDDLGGVLVAEFAALPLFGFLGLSFYCFRAIDLLITISEKRLKQKPTLSETFVYLFFFPVFAQGPVTRSLEFFKQQRDPELANKASFSLDTWLRLFFGLFKILFIGRLFYLLTPFNPEALPFIDQSFLCLLISVYCLYIYIYVEFSGVSDVAISLGRMFGFSIPENFNSPFLASNPQEFWNRWHISLSNWFRDFVFFNITRAIFKTKLPYKQTLLTYAPIIGTFTTVGIWHGLEPKWLMYGLVHGVAISLFVMIKNNKKKFPKLVQQAYDSRAATWVGVFLTFNFTAFMMLIVLPNSVILRIIQ